MYRYIEANYKLFVNNGDGLQLVEKTTQGNPLKFYTGLGMALDAFEENIAKYGDGENFEFTIGKDHAYGDRRDNMVFDIAKDHFMKDGVFDSANVHEDAIIPLLDENGNRFVGRVVSVGDESVRVDLNHPLAGMDITFSGKILVNREATEEEIEKLKQAHHSHHCCGATAITTARASTNAAAATTNQRFAGAGLVPANNLWPTPCSYDTMVTALSVSFDVADKLSEIVSMSRVVRFSSYCLRSFD